MLTDVLEVLTTCIIRTMSALMMEAVSPPETSTDFYHITQCNIPEDSHLLVAKAYLN
jgi:hypothetical protein